MSEEVSLCPGYVSDVCKEELYPTVQGRNLRKGFPQVVEKLESVELLGGAVARDATLRMVSHEMNVEGGVVFRRDVGWVFALRRASVWA